MSSTLSVLSLCLGLFFFNLFYAADVFFPFLSDQQAERVRQKTRDRRGLSRPWEARAAPTVAAGVTLTRKFLRIAFRVQQTEHRSYYNRILVIIRKSEILVVATRTHVNPTTTSISQNAFPILHAW